MQRAHVISWMDVDYEEEDPMWNPDDPYYDHRILAEGDSWFTIAGIPTSNLLFSMRFNVPTVIANCARPGDTIRNMSQISRNIDLRQAMQEAYGSYWDAILLSGGGNDLIDDAGEIIIKPPGSPSDPAAYCNESRLQQVMQDIRDGYRRIVDLRDRAGSSCAGKPVVTHTYDWVTPRNSPSLFFGMPILGPWLYTALREENIPQNRWNVISDYLLGRLQDTIRSLTQGPDRLPNFHVVVTQNTLRRAELNMTLESNDWLNEIHPNSDGYKKIGAKITNRLRQLLP